MTEAAPRAGRREWMGLAILALTATLVSFDVFVLLLALPQLSSDLGASSTEQLWIMDMYGFMVGGFLITMGTLGDRIGRRRLLLVGAAVFGLASLLAAFAPTPEILIAARVLLGISGATLAPSSLALISNMFRDPKQMGVAIGIWAGGFSVGAIVGPIAGGVLLNHFWWGSAFLIGVPVMALLLALGPVLLPEYKAPQAGRLDLPSVALSLAAVLPFVYGLKETARQGLAPLPLLALVAGILVGVLFVRRQKTLRDPLLDLRLFGDTSFSTAVVSMLLYSMLTGTAMLFITQYFQAVEGMTPLASGLGLLPGMAASIAGITVSPILARRIRPAYLIAGGLALVVTGFVLMLGAEPGSGTVWLVVGWTLNGLGGGPLVSLGTNLVVGSAPPEKAGAAGSISQTGNEFGYGLGIAVVGTLGTAVYRHVVAGTLPAGLPASAVDSARESVAGAASAVRTLPEGLAAGLSDAASKAYVTGLHTVVGLTAVLLTGVAVLIAVVLRHVPPLGAPDTEAPVAEPPGETTSEARPDPASAS
ncbi:MFS transporter [Streptomyces sp. CNQ085]|uniref:MFS transporter n=1 Tax=Streptomyces sp. CNQ085 TaxID=2886944 RepID=UPI001F50C539|nr:MFS transporter [Streptomyces sp. CNQ085]MCI0384731.1 MFS transporter [Streptomyces sp. CNQ085]